MELFPPHELLKYVENMCANIPHRGLIRCMSLMYGSCSGMLSVPSRGDLVSEPRERERPEGRGRVSERPEERD